MDIVVILGKYLNDDGSMEQELIDRLDLGIKTFLTTKSDYLAISGGMANIKAGISEADAMAKYVLSKGININKLIIENKSKTTVENALYLSIMLKDTKIDTMYLVSSKYHFYRTDYPTCDFLFRKFFPSIKIVNTYEK